MFYFRCPTCRTEFANKILIWQNELNKICHSEKTLEENDIYQAKILDELEIKQPCCRMRFITYLDKNSVIK